MKNLKSNGSFAILFLRMRSLPLVFISIFSQDVAEPCRTHSGLLPCNLKVGAEVPVPSSLLLLFSWGAAVSVGSMYPAVPAPSSGCTQHPAMQLTTARRRPSGCGPLGRASGTTCVLLSNSSLNFRCTRHRQLPLQCCWPVQVLWDRNKRALPVFSQLTTLPWSPGPAHSCCRTDRRLAVPCSPAASRGDGRVARCLPTNCTPTGSLQALSVHHEV